MYKYLAKRTVLDTIIFIFALCLLFLSHEAPASSSLDYDDSPREGKRALNWGIGFILDPDAFLVSPGLDFYMSNGLSLGPGLQIGINDNSYLFTFEAALKYTFDIDVNDFMRRFKPFIQFGSGFAIFHTDTRGVSQTDYAAVFNFGFGFFIFLTNSVALGNHMLFNVFAPSAGDHFAFSWHFVTIRYLF